MSRGSYLNWTTSRLINVKTLMRGPVKIIGQGMGAASVVAAASSLLCMTSIKQFYSTGKS